MPTTDTLASRLVAARKSAGLTQQGLATKADRAVSTVSRIERGKMTRVSLAVVEDLARGCGVSPKRLTGNRYVSRRK